MAGGSGRSVGSSFVKSRFVYIYVLGSPRSGCCSFDLYGFNFLGPDVYAMTISVVPASLVEISLSLASLQFLAKFPGL